MLKNYREGRPQGLLAAQVLHRGQPVRDLFHPRGADAGGRLSSTRKPGRFPPEVHSDRTLHLGWLIVQHDSSNPPGEPVILRPSYAFLDRYVRPLQNAENVTVFSDADYRGHQGGAEEGHVEVRMTDAAYWEVFRFDFRQGRPYGSRRSGSRRFRRRDQLRLRQTLLRFGGGRGQERAGRRAELPGCRGGGRRAGYPHGEPPGTSGCR